MSFLHRVAGLTLCDRVRTLTIHGSRAAVPRNQEEPVEVVQDAPWSAPSRAVSGTSDCQDQRTTGPSRPRTC